MRLMNAILIAALVVQPTAFAKTSKDAKPAVVQKKAGKKVVAKAKSKKAVKNRGKFVAKILSYRELMRLSKKKRMAYLRDMSRLLVIMDRYQKSYEVADNTDMQELKYQVAQTLRMFDMMPEADASLAVKKPGKSKKPAAVTVPAVAPVTTVTAPWYQNWADYIAGKAQGVQTFAQANLTNWRTQAADYDATAGVKSENDKKWDAAMAEYDRKSKEILAQANADKQWNERVMHPYSLEVKRILEEKAEAAAVVEYQTQTATLVTASPTLTQTTVGQCPEGLAWNDFVGGCLLKNRDGSIDFAMSGTGKSACPDGFIMVPNPEAGSVKRVKACMPKGNWDQLPAQRQADLKAAKFLPQGFFRTASLDEHKAAIGTPAAPGTPAATGTTTEPKAPVAGLTPVEAPATNGLVGDPANGNADAATSGDAPAAGTDAAVTDAPVAGTEPQTAAAPAAQEGASCEPEKLACVALTEEQKKVAGDNYRNNIKSDPNCIAGGMMQKYSGNVKKKGGCKPFRSFRANMGGQESDLVKCEEPSANKGMCNPITFCLTVDAPDGAGGITTTPWIYCSGKANMTGSGADYTEQCNKDFNAYLKKEKRILIDGVDITDTVKECDPFAMSAGMKGVAGMEGIKERWDEIANHTNDLLKSWCTDARKDEFQGLFCRECQILVERVYAMNKAAGVVGCTLDRPEGTAPAAPATTDPVDPASPPSNAIIEGGEPTDRD